MTLYPLDETQQQIARSLREFVEREVQPTASKLEHNNEYPHALVESMKKLGPFNANAEILFAGTSGDFVGLDQCNVRLRPSLAGSGEIRIALTVDGNTSNTVKARIKWSLFRSS